MTITELIEGGHTFAPDVMPFNSFPVENGGGAGRPAIDVLNEPYTPHVIATETTIDETTGQTPQILPEIVVTASRPVPTWVWWAGAGLVAWWLFSRRA